MLWSIWREAEVVKLNINVDRDLGIPGLHSLINVGTNKPLFSLIWRRSESIPANRDVALRNAIAGRIHPPITAESLGRKVCIVVDGRDNEMERPVIGIEHLPRLKSYETADDRNRFAKIKIVFLFGDSEQQMAAALRNEYPKQRDQRRYRAAN